MTVGIQGIKELAAKIKAYEEKKAKGLRKGLYMAGLFLQRESMKIVPIKTGLLRASASTRNAGTADAPEVVVGYGTDYGLYVHENLEAEHKPGKTAKFLTLPLYLRMWRIKSIVIDTLRKSGGV